MKSAHVKLRCRAYFCLKGCVNHALADTTISQPLREKCALLCRLDRHLFDVVYRPSRPLQYPRKQVGVPRDVLEADRKLVVWESIVVCADADVVNANQVLDVLNVA